MSIKGKIKKLIYKQYVSSETYVEYLRSKGASIGEGTYFYTPEDHPVDESAAQFLTVGRNCRITDGAMILLHDYSYAVLRPTHHAMLLKAGETIIGDNVFIGAKSIVLMNTTIGDNVIIGAGSVVSGKFGSNVVIAGNPARVICSLDEYYDKCLAHFDENAKTFYKKNSAMLKRALKENEMRWYVALWKTENEAERREYLNSLKVDGDDKAQTVEDVMNWKPKYESFKEFVDSIDDKKY